MKTLDELARLLATPEGLRVARLLQASGTLVAPAASAEGHPGEQELPAPSSREGGSLPPGREAVGSGGRLGGGRPANPRAPAISHPPSEIREAREAIAEPRPISIWQPKERAEGQVFERPDPGPLGDHYATRKTIPAKKTARQRICFFGESAAAGYLYAPHLTPAQVLEEQLNHVEGVGTFEVIDLARTNETLGPLVATAEAAMQLSPDLLVIYTGNNWNLLETPELSPYAPSVRARQRYAEALAEGGVLGPARRARLEIARLAGEAFATVAALGVPVVLVIPEVNLADWESLQPVVWLQGEGTARWYEAYRRALAHLAEGQAAEAEAAAWEMVELDGGSNPTPFRLLARACALAGRSEDERDACISEVDSQPYALLGFLGAPQATTVGREILAHAAERHGFTAVDLRPLFAEHGGSLLPGRRFFLDYCHLTVEGMQVAMAAVTAEVLRLIDPKGEGESWRDLLERLPAPEVSPEADAVAKLGAALHNAHRLLPVIPETKLSLLTHWCEAALDASPGAAEALFDVAAARATPGPAVLSAAFARNFASPYRLLLQHGWRWEFLDADLLQALADALVRKGHSDAKEKIDRLLLSRYALPLEGVDLSRPPFLAEPLARFFPEAMATPGIGGRSFYRSPWPESTFCLISDGTQEIDLVLTARRPSGAGETTLEIEGSRVGNIDLQERWSRHALQVDRRSLRRGLNRLTLRWPPPSPRGEAALAEARRRLEEGIEADLHPVFGEVFSLFARPGHRR